VWSRSSTRTDTGVAACGSQPGAQAAGSRHHPPPFLNIISNRLIAASISSLSYPEKTSRTCVLGMTIRAIRRSPSGPIVTSRRRPSASSVTPVADCRYRVLFRARGMVRKKSAWVIPISLSTIVRSATRTSPRRPAARWPARPPRSAHATDVHWAPQIRH